MSTKKRSHSTVHRRSMSILAVVGSCDGLLTSSSLLSCASYAGGGVATSSVSGGFGDDAGSRGLLSPEMEAEPGELPSAMGFLTLALAIRIGVRSWGWTPCSLSCSIMICSAGLMSMCV